MKKVLLLGLLMLFLSGCAAQETFETLGNAYDEPASADAWQILVDMPPDIAVPIMETEKAGQLYLGNGYMLITHTTKAGDLNGTLLDCTGFGKESLSLMQTETGDWKRYEAVWSAAGEGGDRVGRIAVLDDGNYHYVLTAMADAQKSEELSDIWQPIFRSFRIVEPESLVNTGS